MRTSFSKRTLSSAWASAKRIFSATGVCRHSAALRGDSNQRGLEADLARSRARTAPRRDAAARMTMPNDPRPSSTPSFSVSLLTFQSFISRSFIAAPLVQLRLHRRRHAGPHLGERGAGLSGSQEGLEAIKASTRAHQRRVRVSLLVPRTRPTLRARRITATREQNPHHVITSKCNASVGCFKTPDRGSMEHLVRLARARVILVCRAGKRVAGGPSRQAPPTCVPPLDPTGAGRPPRQRGCCRGAEAFFPQRVA